MSPARWPWPFRQHGQELGQGGTSLPGLRPGVSCGWLIQLCYLEDGPRSEASSACGLGLQGPGSTPKGSVLSPGAQQATGTGLYLTKCLWSVLGHLPAGRSSAQELAGVCPTS